MDFQLSRREASKLLLTISAQMLLLMGAYWGVNMVSAAMKTISAGMSTALTAGAQGTLAWYATYVTGIAAQNMVCQREILGLGRTPGDCQRNTGLIGQGFNFANRAQRYHE